MNQSLKIYQNEEEKPKQIPFLTWQIRYVELDKSSEIGEQGGTRPCIISSNAANNYFCPTVEVLLITGHKKREQLPCHVVIEDFKRYGLDKESTILAEQKKVINKSKLGDVIGFVTDPKLRQAIADAYYLQCGFFE